MTVCVNVKKFKNEPKFPGRRLRPVERRVRSKRGGRRLKQLSFMVDGKDPGSAYEPGSAPVFDSNLLALAELMKSPIVVSVLSVVALLCLVYALSVVSLVAGYLVPILYTFISLRDDNAGQQSFWLQYWLVFVCLLTAEAVCLPFVGRSTVYHVVKLAALYWLMARGGATTVYRYAIRQCT